MLNGSLELIILLTLINIIFAISLNLILGYNGQFSLGHAGFLCVGAYTSGVLTHSFDWPLWAGIAMAMVLAAIVSVLVGYPCLRLRGDYLAIATLGFAEIIRIVILALPPDIFGGAMGMTNVDNFSKYIPLPSSFNGIGNLTVCILTLLVVLSLFVWMFWGLAGMLAALLNRFRRWAHWRWVALGLFAVPVIMFSKPIWIKTFGAPGTRGMFEFKRAFVEDSWVFSAEAMDSRLWAVVIVFTLLVACVTWLVRNYLNSVPGRAVIAIREDEIAATNLGVNCTWMKLQNFMFGAALAGLAGALGAHTWAVFRPMDFNFFKSVDVLLMVVLGGMGSLTGSFIGAMLITVLVEVLRFLNEWRMVIYALVLVLFMVLRPGGLLGTRELKDLIKIRGIAHWLIRSKKGVPDA